MAVTKSFSGQRLRELRERAGVSRIDLAFVCRRTEQMVYLWERGRVRPMPDVLPQIAARLGCQIDDLFDDASNGTRDLAATGHADAQQHAIESTVAERARRRGEAAEGEQA